MKTKSWYRFFLFVLLLAGLLAAPQSDAACPNYGLVAHYSFNGCTANDESGNANNGTLVGNQTCVPGLEGKAFKFGGIFSPGYITIPNSPSLSFLDNYTFTLWFNIQDYTSMEGWGRVSEYGLHTIFAKAGDRNGLDLRTTRAVGEDSLSFYADSGWCCGGGGGAIGAVDRFKLNEWHMATITSGNGEVKLYLDCKLQGSMPTAQFNVNPAMATMPLQLGIDQGAVWYPIDGMLDDVRVYNRALDQQEIGALYSEWGVGTCAAANRPPVANAGPDQTAGCGGTNGTSVTLDGSASSDPDGNALTYTWTWNGDSASGVRPVITLPLGATTITLTVDDDKGGTATDTVAVTVQDATSPATVIRSIAGIAGDNGWYRSAVTVILDATDDCSGVKEIRTIGDGGTISVPGRSAAVTFPSEGTNNFSYYAVDNAGNSEIPHPLTIKIDKTPPTITASVSFAVNAAGWYNEDVTVTFACNDGISGIASCTSPVTVTTEGAGQVVTGTAVDKAGNTAAASVTLNIDKTPPAVAVSVTPGLLWPPNHKMVTVTPAVSVTDANPGTTVKLVSVTSSEPDNGLGDGDTANDIAINGDGTILLRAERSGAENGRVYTITYQVTDIAGNSAIASATVTVPHNK